MAAPNPIETFPIEDLLYEYGVDVVRSLYSFIRLAPPSNSAIGKTGSRLEGCICRAAPIQLGDW